MTARKSKAARPEGGLANGAGVLAPEPSRRAVVSDPALRDLLERFVRTKMVGPNLDSALPITARELRFILEEGTLPP